MDCAEPESQQLDHSPTSCPSDAATRDSGWSIQCYDEQSCVLIDQYLLVTLECSKPHEPVQSVVIGRDETGSLEHIAGLAFELVFLPHRLTIVHLTVGGLYYNLCPLFGHTEMSELRAYDLSKRQQTSPSKCSVGVDNSQWIKGPAM